MLVTFLETRRISEDGFTVKRCVKDKSYDLRDEAARRAIRQGWAREATLEELVGSINNAARQIQPVDIGEALFQAHKPVGA